jgi:flagellum-specific ATP synthase
VLGSVSRVMSDVTSDEHRKLAGRLREVLATYNNARDLIDIGAYAHGSNPRIDDAIRLMPAATAFLRQDAHEPSNWAETVLRLQGVFADAELGSAPQS